jgi:hypothetical protein
MDDSMNSHSHKRFTDRWLAILAGLLIGNVGFAAPAYEGGSKEVPLSNEREVKVNLNAGFGNVYVSMGSSQHLLEAEVVELSSEALQNCVAYNLRDKIGYLNIDTECEPDYDSDRKKKKVHFTGWDSRTWNLNFSDAVPLSFDIDLGLGKGVLDFTGLSVKNLNLSTGASSVTLKFDKPNKSVIEDLNIETGLSKFVARGLCNANFRHLRFEGGVGGYTLDFGGTLDKEVDVDLEVGLGSLTVIIPKNIGVKIFYEQNFMSQIDLDKDFEEQEEDIYYSSNYEDAKGKMNIRIEAGLGGVKIKRE